VSAERLYYDFETGAVDLAEDVNGRLASTHVSAPPGHGVWLDRRLRDGWASIRYLVDETEVTLTDPYDPVLTTGPGTAYLWPHDLDLPRLWSARAPGLRLSMRPGSQERGDLESAARLLYIAVDAGPAGPILQPRAVFTNGLVLVTGELEGVPGGVRVDTSWAVEHPLATEPTSFVQVLDRGARVAGSDAPIAAGWFPARYWLPGDRVLETRTIQVPGGYDPARHQVIVGRYEPPSLERIGARLAGEAGQADHVIVVP
jgi:hypothetical protein